MNKNVFKESLESMLQMQIDNERLASKMNASLNLKLLEIDEENLNWVDFVYQAKESHTNAYGGIHGGIACAILDTCAGFAIAAFSQRSPSTVSLTTNYLLPMCGTDFRIHVVLNHIGNKVASATGEIYDQNTNELCVTSLIQYILLNHTISEI